MISPQYVDGLELRIKELTAERDALAAHKMEAHKLIGIPASVGVCEPIEGFAERPQDIVPTVRDMALRIKDLETERDEWKAQAEGEAIVAGSYRDERDELAALCAEAADVLDKTANDTLLGRNMADKLRRQAGGEE